MAQKKKERKNPNSGKWKPKGEGGKGPGDYIQFGASSICLQLSWARIRY